MEVLTRRYYADIVDSWIGKGNIIAIVGARRVGKSYVVKDIIERHDIRNIPFLNNLIVFYADTTGKLTSANSISKYITRDREFGPLEKIRDNHPKYVISATPLLTQRDENGITHLSLRKFLKEGF